MVRGTYLPWPKKSSARQVGIAAEREHCYSVRTGLGKEGAEALVGVSGFTLVGQVAIGLRGDNASVVVIAQILGGGGRKHT